jgi:FixJ family two-component response regulator
MYAPLQALVAVVDDDPRVLQSLENLLESSGFAVRRYASGAAFLDDPMRHEIDCLIVDVGMPVMDGVELQRLAALKFPNLPVVLVTGRHELGSAGATAANNRGIFLKPFDGLELLQAVAVAIQDVRRSPAGPGSPAGPAA